VRREAAGLEAGYLSNAPPSNLLTQSGDLQSATRPTGVPSFRSRIAIAADERTRRRWSEALNFA
jgi:hypothetical protein